MTTSNRSAILNKVHKVLKKQYKPHIPRGEQPLLEAMLFACCLENAPHETAEQVYAAARSSFFDWNEVRVSTVKELSEVMIALPEPAAAAGRMKGILQCVFESEYSFDLESLKKQNLGQAIKRLQKLDGISPFVVAYATQVSLGGHAIPIDRGTLEVLTVLGVISPAEAAAGNVPGMERTIPKSKGQEFGALVHQLGAEFLANPFSPTLRELLVSIAPDAKDRMPKRGAKKLAVEPPPGEPASKKKPGHKEAAEKHAAGGKKKETAGAKKHAPAASKAPAAHPKKSAAIAKKKASLKPLSKRKPR